MVEIHSVMLLIIIEYIFTLYGCNTSGTWGITAARGHGMRERGQVVSLGGLEPETQGDQCGRQN
jgi:hypothetical protein